MTRKRRLLRTAMSFTISNVVTLKRLVVQLRVRCRNETLEQWVRLVRFALEFGMELAGDKKRMLRDFDHLDQFAVGREAAEGEAGFFEAFAIGVVEFVTMAMAFFHDKRAVNL